MLANRYRYMVWLGLCTLPMQGKVPMEELQPEGEDFNTPYWDGGSPLCKACEQGDQAQVLRLQEQQGKVASTRDFEIAYMNGYREICKQLLAYGEALQPDLTSTCLYFITEEDDAMTRHIIASNKVSLEDVKIFRKACSLYDEEELLTLLARKETELTANHFVVACGYGYQQVAIQSLQGRAFDANAPIPHYIRHLSDLPPLHIACYYGLEDVVDYLLRQGVAPEKVKGHHPLSLVLYAAQDRKDKEGHATVVAKLLEAEQQLPQRIRAKRSEEAFTYPLHIACAYGVEDKVRELVEDQMKHGHDNGFQEPGFYGRYEEKIPIEIACECCSHELVEALLPTYLSPLDPASKHFMLGCFLLAACQGGKAATVELLMHRYNLDPQTIKDKDRHSPLYIARQKGHAKVIEVLLKKYTLTELQEQNEYQTLCEEGTVEAIACMLATYPQIDPFIAEEGGQSLFYIACSGSDHSHASQKAAYLLDRHKGPIDFTQQAKDGKLLFSLVYQHPALARVLLTDTRLAPSQEVLVDMGTDGRVTTYPLHLACTSRAEYASEVVANLLARGADPNQRDSLGWLPLQYAVYKGNQSTIDSLLHHDRLDPNLRMQVNTCVRGEGYSRDNGQYYMVEHYPLHIACEYHLADAVRSLLARGANPHQAVERGRAYQLRKRDKLITIYPLHIACEGDMTRSTLDMVKALSNAGANFAQHDGLRRLFYTEAMKIRDYETEQTRKWTRKLDRFITQRQKFISAAKEGNSTLVEELLPSMHPNLIFRIACEKNNGFILEKLLEDDRLDPNQQDEHGNTALHAFAAQGRLEVVKFLVEQCRARLDVPNNKGKTAIEIGKPAVVAYLQEKKRVVNGMVLAHWLKAAGKTSMCPQAEETPVASRFAEVIRGMVLDYSAVDLETALS